MRAKATEVHVLIATAVVYESASDVILRSARDW